MNICSVCFERIITVKKFEKDGRTLVVSYGYGEARLSEFDRKNYSKLRFQNFMKNPSLQNIGVFMLPSIILGSLLAICFNSTLIFVISLLVACFTLLAALMILNFFEAKESFSSFFDAELLKYLSVNKVFELHDKSVEVSRLKVRREEAEKVLEDTDENSSIYADVEKKVGLIVQEYKDAVDELRLLENNLIEWSKAEELKKKEQAALEFLTN